MGMSASQARLLSLQARQSNLEYQGQQINQERTILSQQCTALYNSLLAMTVPTPPSTQDYTTIEYSGTIGATNYTFDASSVKPGNNGSYIVTVKQEAYGDSLEQNSSIATVNNNSSGTLNAIVFANTVTEDTEVGTGTYSQSTEASNTYMIPYTLGENDDPTEYYVFDGSYRKATQADKDANKDFYKIVSQGNKPDNGVPVKEDTKTVHKGEARPVTLQELSNLYVLSDDNVSLRKATIDDVDGESEPFTLRTNTTYYQESSEGLGNSFNIQGAVSGIEVDGHEVYELENAPITEEQKSVYETAITNSGLQKPNGEPYTASDFYIYFNDSSQACFALKSDVNDGNNNAKTYTYISNGKYSKPTTYNDCKLTFDPTSGRITELSIPNYATTTDEDGNKIYDYSKIESYTTMAVEAEKVTDEKAYQDAYAQYEYAQYEYDKAQQDINAKTEIIQQEDRNLELKLQRLDNERTQITTEIEAVDKVINDNIEASYKTFSG